MSINIFPEHLSKFITQKVLAPKHMECYSTEILNPAEPDRAWETILVVEKEELSPLIVDMLDLPDTIAAGGAPLKMAIGERVGWGGDIDFKSGAPAMDVVNTMRKHGMFLYAICCRETSYGSVTLLRFKNGISGGIDDSKIPSDEFIERMNRKIPVRFFYVHQAGTMAVEKSDPFFDSLKTGDRVSLPNGAEYKVHTSHYEPDFRFDPARVTVGFQSTDDTPAAREGVSTADVIMTRGSFGGTIGVVGREYDLDIVKTILHRCEIGGYGIMAQYPDAIRKRVMRHAFHPNMSFNKYKEEALYIRVLKYWERGFELAPPEEWSRLERTTISFIPATYPVGIVPIGGKDGSRARQIKFLGGFAARAALVARNVPAPNGEKPEE